MKLSKAWKMISWRKIRGHLKTINEHKLLVMKHCFRIGLYKQGLLHDLSKYMPSELLMGFLYYDDGKSSPNNGERRDKGYSAAWMHHKGRNRHHFEYWTDYSLHPVEKNGKSHYLLHPQTEKELHGMLRILDERGEETLMRFVRDYYLKGYKI